MFVLSRAKGQAEKRTTMTYEITFGRDAKSFWDVNQASLSAHESAYNLPIGLLLGIISAERTWGEPS